MLLAKIGLQLGCGDAVFLLTRSGALVDRWGLLIDVAGVPLSKGNDRGKVL